MPGKLVGAIDKEEWRLVLILLTETMTSLLGDIIEEAECRFGGLVRMRKKAKENIQHIQFLTQVHVETMSDTF